MSHGMRDGSVHSLRCFAVTDDRAFASLTRTELFVADMENPLKFWIRVRSEIDEARHRLPVTTPEWPVSDPVDCVASWMNPMSWGLHGDGDPICPSARGLANFWAGAAGLNPVDQLSLEREAQQTVDQQVAAAVERVLDALDRDLLELVKTRRRLSVSVVHGLLSRAARGGAPALHYAYQALRTEPLGLLDLIANGEPEGGIVGMALLSGRSLPKALEGIGIAQAVHRRAVRREVPLSRTRHFGCGLSELPIPGRVWLAVMRRITTLPVEKWPRNSADWSTYLSLLHCLDDLRVAAQIQSDITLWCLSRGYAECGSRLTHLLGKARAIQTAANALAGTSICMGDVLSLALDLVPSGGSRRVSINAIKAALAPTDVASTLVQVARFCTKSVAELTIRVFEHHPGMPQGFVGPHPYDIRALSTVELCLEHGAACNVCLQNECSVVRYIADGAALWAVKGPTGESLGTIALCFDDSGAPPQVRVRQVTGFMNARTFPELRVLAQELAASFGVADLGRWIDYAFQCRELCRSAGAV